jgi:hypothetical protein
MVHYQKKHPSNIKYSSLDTMAYYAIYTFWDPVFGKTIVTFGGAQSWGGIDFI